MPQTFLLPTLIRACLQGKAVCKPFPRLHKSMIILSMTTTIIPTPIPIIIVIPSLILSVTPSLIRAGLQGKEFPTSQGAASA